MLPMGVKSAMTPKELRHLRRSDLLEMLLELSRENADLRQEIQFLRQQLEDRTVTILNSGSLAEAAMQLNGVFEAAQAACQQYTENIRSRSENVELYCKQLEQQTRERCEQMIADAQRCAEEVRRSGENPDPVQDNGESQ